jgi:hypothetical protein
MREAISLIAFIFLLQGYIWGTAQRTSSASEIKITITEISGRPITSSSVPLGLAGGVEIRGKVTGLGQAEGAKFVAQVVVQRLYDKRWWVVGSSSLHVMGERLSKPQWRWVVPNVRLPLPDYGKGFEIRAVLVKQGNGELSKGLVDYETVRRYAVSFADPVQGNTGEQQNNVKPIEGPCFVEITNIKNIYGEQISIRPGSKDPIEVDLSPIVEGRLDKPKKGIYEPYLVVQASTDDKKWVMDRKGTVSGRRWTETAYFGRKGMDKAVMFRVQAIVSKRPLPHGGYAPDEWRNLETSICARSGEIMVMRRITAGDLVITRVDDKSVIGRTPVTVAPESQVEGEIEDPQPENILMPGETVWILSRPVNTKGWTVEALALPAADGVSWRVPSLSLSRPDQHNLIAVASLVRLPRGQVLSDDEWYRLVNARLLRRLSRMVIVNVQQAKPQ